MGPLYLRLSLTSRCNFRCSYCRPELEQQLEPLPDDRLLELVQDIAAAHPVGKIRLTGGEPLLRPGLPQLVRRLARALPGVELQLTTNGTLLGPRARELRQAGVRGVNISLDALSPGRFRAVTGGDLKPVLAGLAAAREAGLEPIKLNAVLMRSINGDHLHRLVELAARRNSEMRFIELMPIGVAAQIHRREYLSSDEALLLLRRRFRYLGAIGLQGTAVRHRFRVGRREATVGLISAVSSPFCDSCNRLRLDAAGRLIACLRGSPTVELAGLTSGAVAAAVADALATRGAAHWSQRPMVAIGG